MKQQYPNKMVDTYKNKEKKKEEDYKLLKGVKGNGMSVAEEKCEKETE